MAFFKTTWFKCIACLLRIAVISGALLAALNDLLYVSPETRTARAISKIYGEEKLYFTILDTDALIDGGDELKQNPIEYDGVGRIDKIYEIDDDLLFRTTGYKGYKNGTVTLWIRTAGNGETYSIEKVLLETSEKHTLMSKLSGGFYDEFCLTDVTETYKNGRYFSAEDKSAENYNPVSGATYSATAAANAVNCVIRYLGGEK